MTYHDIDNDIFIIEVIKIMLNLRKLFYIIMI